MWSRNSEHGFRCSGDCGYRYPFLGEKIRHQFLKICNKCFFFQGCVVVLGAWSTWTYDLAEYENNSDAYNYCAYTPMMTAFVILLIKWVRNYFQPANDLQFFLKI